MFNNCEEIKTGAWKEIQLSFHNFRVTKDLGMRFPIPESKHKKRYVQVECIMCLKKYEGQYAIFKSRDKVCVCDRKVGKGQIKWCTPTRERILKIRNGMIYRCHNKKSHNYEDYGGRGIKVCNKWLKFPEDFYNWALNNGYKDGLTIERINNNKGYSSKNCKWITKGEQSLNKRNNLTDNELKKIAFLLEKGMSKFKIAKYLGRAPCTIHRNINNKKIPLVEHIF